MKPVSGQQAIGDAWSITGAKAAAGALTGQSVPGNAGETAGMSGEQVTLSPGAANNLVAPFACGPVLFFVAPGEVKAPDAGGAKGGPASTGNAPAADEPGEQKMAHAVQHLKDILSDSKLSDDEKGGLLAQALDTLVSAGSSFKAETEALIAKAKSEQERLNALLGTVRP